MTPESFIAAQERARGMKPSSSVRNLPSLILFIGMVQRGVSVVPRVDVLPTGNVRLMKQQQGDEPS